MRLFAVTLRKSSNLEGKAQIGLLLAPAVRMRSGRERIAIEVALAELVAIAIDPRAQLPRKRIWRAGSFGCPDHLLRRPPVTAR